jgi:hypothetical protein
MRAVVTYLAAGLVGGLAWASAAAGDEVRFHNGDRLTGTIISADGGKLKVKTSVAGTVEVDLADVRGFRSDGPLELVLKDGTRSRRPVVAGDPPVAVIARPSATVPSATRRPGRAGFRARRRSHPAAAASGSAPDGAVAVPVAAIRSINHKDGWTGTMVAGGLIARGNSDTDAFNLSVDAARRTAVDRLNLSGQYLFARQRDEDRQGDEGGQRTRALARRRPAPTTGGSAGSTTGSSASGSTRSSASASRRTGSPA